jgi:hypothetical protein
MSRRADRTLRALRQYRSGLGQERRWTEADDFRSSPDNGRRQTDARGPFCADTVEKVLFG